MTGDILSPGGRFGQADVQLVAPAVANLQPYQPAPSLSALAEEAGINPDAVTLLAANENALGPSEKALEAIQRHLTDAHRYPDASGIQLKEALAEFHGVGREHIALGNGSSELIELLVRTFVGPGETVVTAWPSYAVYRLASITAGREALVAPLRRDSIDLSALATFIDQRTKIVFIANPNNPTGSYVSRRNLTAFLKRIPQHVIVVVDEAYADFVDAEDYPQAVKDFQGYPRLVVLRTFSKAYGLAGLRVGYAVMPPFLVRFLDSVRMAYNVNSLGQVAALAALGDQEHVERSKRMVVKERNMLDVELRKFGFSPVPSQTNFLCVRTPEGIEGSSIVAGLRGRGILVRALDSYGLNNALRLTVGTPKSNRRLLNALAELV